MGKVWIPGGGGAGSGSDECTATRAEVLKGYGAITKDSDDEVVEGTLELTGTATDSQVLNEQTYYNINAKTKRTGSMVNQGSVSASLNAGGIYTIPAGYHNGGGKVTANSLASQTAGNAGPGAILAGYNAWVNGNKVPGSIPIQGADVSGTDRAWSTNISCWEGTACLGVRNAHYLNGVNWIQGNIPNFYAGNIKKDVNMGGLVGTFEGYVPTATDLYLRGNNIYAWGGMTSDSYSLDSGQISALKNAGSLYSSYAVPLTGHTRLNIQGYANNGAGVLKVLRLYRKTPTSGSQIGYLDLQNYGAGNYTFSFDISAYQFTDNVTIGHSYLNGAIYRIWLS